jgi:hypothetical protein
MSGPLLLLDPDTVRFDPPAPDVLRNDQSLRDFANVLRSCPGEWALLGRETTAGCARQKAYRLRHGALRQFPAGQFETQSKAILGEFRVYVRYVGGEST